MDFSPFEEVVMYLFPLILFGWALFSAFLIKKKIVSLPSISSIYQNTYAPIREIFALLVVLLICAALFLLIPPFVERSLLFLSSSRICSSIRYPQLTTHLASSLVLALSLHFVSAWLQPSLREKIIGDTSIVAISRLMKGVGFALLLFPFFIIIHAVLQFCALSFSYMEWHKQIALSLFEQARHISFAYLLIAIFTISCLAPIIEEFLFRGVLYSALESFVHPLLALIVNASIFAFLHFSLEQGSANYAIIGTLFIFGVLSSIIKKQERSLASSIGFHAGFNSLSVASAMLFQ